MAAVGKNVPKPIAELSEMEQAMRYVIQDRFAQLGARWIAVGSANWAKADLSQASQRIVNLEAEREENVKVLATANLQISSLMEQKADLSQRIVNFDAKLSAIYRSTSWRLTKPLRAIKYIGRRLSRL